MKEDELRPPGDGGEQMRIIRASNSVEPQKTIYRHAPADYPPLSAVKMNTSAPGATGASRPTRFPSMKTLM
jgi:hypothetical protein